MQRTYFLLTTAVMCHAVAFAQTQPGAMSFQQADSLAAGRGGRGINILPLLRPDTGKPFSATVTTQTTQTFLDGTHVSQTSATLEYRDADGRTRTEPAGSSSGPARNIEIRDPVAGVMYGLNPANRSAVKSIMPGNSAGSTTPRATAGRGVRSGNGATDPNSDAAVKLREIVQRLTDAEAAVQMLRKNPNETVEDLGMATINGVPARGTRTTTVVPVGAIGNDREFRSVSERWFSPDLNLLIKSVSTDPRFGTTTHELTNISRQPPDPSLFQPPADYYIISNSPTQPASKAIEEIDIRGARRVSTDTLKALLLSKVGDTYDEERIRTDFTALWKTGRFEDVQVKTEPGARGGVIVRFIVTERP